MTILTPADTAGFWTRAGGPANRSAEWVAIAMAESSLETNALSPTGAEGLWQIEYYNSWWAGAAGDDLYDPAANAQAAVYGSGGGTNCAAWDTCYADISVSGRYSFLAYPERGSAAWLNITAAAAAIGQGGSAGAQGGAAPDPVDQAGRVFSALFFDVQVTIPQYVRDIQITTASIAPIYGPGWR